MQKPTHEPTHGVKRRHGAQLGVELGVANSRQIREHRHHLHRSRDALPRVIPRVPQKHALQYRRAHPVAATTLVPIRSTSIGERQDGRHVVQALHVVHARRFVRVQRRKQRSPDLLTNVFQLILPGVLRLELLARPRHVRAHDALLRALRRRRLRERARVYRARVDPEHPRPIQRATREIASQSALSRETTKRAHRDVVGVVIDDVSAR